MESLKKCILMFSLVFLLTVYLSAEEQKPIIAILDISGDGISENESIAITNLLMITVYDSGLVDLIDRNQREEILSEISFSLSGCVDDKCAIEVGEMLAADAMITGNVNRIGSRLSIDLKVIDVATTRIVATFYKLYENIDDIVDEIDSIGGQIVQNFTGKIAEKKEVFQYEDLVPLIILSEVEGASVYIDGASIGTINDGQISKAVNAGAEVLVTLKMEGYWDCSKLIQCDNETTVTLVMKERRRHWFSASCEFGGGPMGSIYFTLFPYPDWFFISLGMGFNLVEYEPLLLKMPITVKAGSFIGFNDSRPLRVYLGMKSSYGGITKFNDDLYILNTEEKLLIALLFSAFTGIEYKFNDKYRTFLELDIQIEPYPIWYHQFKLAIGASFYF